MPILLVREGNPCHEQQHAMKSLMRNHVILL